jgi:hypothetical protein
MAYVAAGILLRELTAGFSQSCVAATDKAEAITATAVNAVLCTFPIFDSTNMRR